MACGAELLADVEERTDEEIAAEADEAVPVVILAPSVWREVVASGLSVAVLQAAEAEGCRGAVTLLESTGAEVVVDVERNGPGPPRLSVLGPALRLGHRSPNWGLSTKCLPADVLGVAVAGRGHT